MELHISHPLLPRCQPALAFAFLLDQFSPGSDPGRWFVLLLHNSVGTRSGNVGEEERVR